MPKINRSLFPAMLFAALCWPAISPAQTEPGSFDELLGSDFAPLQNSTAQQLPELNAPLIMGPQIPPPQQARPRQGSVLEIPRVTIDEPAPGELVLPDLTIPTPENTAIDSFDDRRTLKPQLENGPQDPIELLPFNDGDRVQLPAPPNLAQRPLPRPQMRSPQALNYGNSAYPSRSRIQVEFFSTSRSFGYQPYGGYRSSGYGRPPAGYRSYGGYVPSGRYGGGYGGGRSCPYSR